MAAKSDQKITKIGRLLTRLERPETIMNMIVGLGIFCLLLMIGDFFHLRHGKFAFEDTFGFYCAFGFAAFAFIIFSTKVLKKLLGRKENYYSPNVIDAEDYPSDELDLKEHGDA